MFLFIYSNRILLRTIKFRSF